MGIIGTVVSLTHVLENLSKPDELGHMIAAAFVATLWGLVSANFIWLPIGARLRRLSELEIEQHDPGHGGRAGHPGRQPADPARGKAAGHGPGRTHWASPRARTRTRPPRRMLEDFKEAA